MYKTKFEKDLTINKDIRVLCENCKIKTKHKVISSVNERGSQTVVNEDWSFDWHIDYEVIQCQGCESISFRSVYSDSETYDYEGNGYREIEQIFPKRDLAMKDIKPFYLPNKITRIYRETIDCYNSESYTLCSAGIRSIVEALCISQNVLDGEVEKTLDNGTVIKSRKNNLQGKINGLYEKGILTKETAESLHNHRFLGNKGLHELDTPTKTELRLAIEIIESILEHLYELPNKVFELKNSIHKNKPMP